MALWHAGGHFAVFQPVTDALGFRLKYDFRLFSCGVVTYAFPEC